MLYMVIREPKSRYRTALTCFVAVVEAKSAGDVMRQMKILEGEVFAKQDADYKATSVSPYTLGTLRGL